MVIKEEERKREREYWKVKIWKMFLNFKEFKNDC